MSDAACFVGCGWAGSLDDVKTVKVDYPSPAIHYDFACPKCGERTPDTTDFEMARELLSEAAPSLLSALEAYHQWMTAHFDDVAEWFYRDTGMMAPGKDEPMAMNSGYTYEEKRQAWDNWLWGRKKTLNDNAAAAIQAARVGEA